MVRDVIKVFRAFAQRCGDDHLGAYAATTAYFLIISFVPFFMIFIALTRQANADTAALTEGLIAVIPSGLKDYVRTIIHEAGTKSYAYVPVSLLILLWSAAKVIHAITNGLNVISKTHETRGWFFLRFRSMIYVVLLLLGIVVLIIVSMSGKNLEQMLSARLPALYTVVQFIRSFGVLFAYFGLILIFLLIYTVLPDCRYTFRSQLPGALIVSTIWMFFSYLMSLYYRHNINFTAIYGSLTGFILAMIWIYFCGYFILVGAELNRVLYEDPDDNLFVNSIDVVRDASSRKAQKIQETLDEYSIWRPITEQDDTLDGQPDDIRIDWEDETGTFDAESGHRKEESGSESRLS